jgi:hypothetical protein
MINLLIIKSCFIISQINQILRKPFSRPEVALLPGRDDFHSLLIAGFLKIIGQAVGAWTGA